MMLQRKALLLRFAAVGAVGLGILIASSGCSALLSLDGASCSSNADCASGQICSASSQVCVAASNPVVVSGEDAGGEPACTTTDACVATHNGEPWICHEPGVTPCAPILSPECNEMAGGLGGDLGGLGWKDPNAVFIGITLPIGGGLTDPALGKVIRSYKNGYKLALDQIANAGNLPGGANGAKRPLIGVFCDEWDVGTGLPQRVGNHLKNNVRVKAVITEDDNNTQALFNELKPAGIMDLCTFCWSERWKTVDDNGLHFSIIPSIGAQVPVGNKLLVQYEAKVRAELGLQTTDPIRVALLGPEQATSAEQITLYEQTMQFNGKSVAANFADGNYQKVVYTGVGGAVQNGVNPLPVAQQLAAFKPHIIMFPGQAEAGALLSPIEGVLQNTPGAPKPYYILNTSALLESTTNFVGGSEDKRKRIVGTMPAPEADLAVGLAKVDSDYFAKFGEKPTGFYTIPYDALYGMAYAIAAAGNPQGGLKGVDIARGIGKLVTPDQNPNLVIDVGPSGLSGNLATVATGTAINLKGTIFNFDFDPTTGVQTGVTSTWCVAKDNAQNNYFYLAGGFPNALKWNVKSQSFNSPTAQHICP